MSEFDEEAERERLREKYGDEAGQTDTERMSQLLLQGATMTNKHCDTCGSPIFRYQGQEFCPTCQAEAQGAAEQEPDTPAQEAAEQEPDTPAQQAEEGDTPAQQASQPTAVQEAAEQEPDTPIQGTAEQEPEKPQRPAADSARFGATGGAESETMDAGEPTAPSRPQPPQREAPAGATTDQSPQEALSETITVLATRARQADPQQAQALLSAAREAAEALSALGAGR